MNRIDRLFSILLLLQAKRTVRAEDIAAKYEISERIVYRDMAALMLLIRRLQKLRMTLNSRHILLSSQIPRCK